MLKSLFGTALTAVLVLTSWSASAAGDTDKEDDLIRRGVEARRHQDDAGALDLFSQAYAIHKSPRAAAQMGLAEIALGRWVQGETHLTEALAGKNDPWIKKNAKILETTLERARQEIGMLEVLGGPPGAEVVIGGEVEGSLPLAKPIHVRAGEVRFELRAPGHTSASRTVRVVAGQLSRETMTLEPVPPPVADTGRAEPSGGAARPNNRVPTPAPDTGAGLRTVGLVLAGAGAVALGGGLLFGLKARSAGQSDSKDPVFDPNAESSGRRYQTLQFVGYGVGAALVGGGLAAYLVGRSRNGETAAAVSFVPTDGGAIGLLTGRL